MKQLKDQPQVLVEEEEEKEGRGQKKKMRNTNIEIYRKPQDGVRPEGAAEPASPTCQSCSGGQWELSLGSRA